MNEVKITVTVKDGFNVSDLVEFSAMAGARDIQTSGNTVTMISQSTFVGHLKQNGMVNDVSVQVLNPPVEQPNMVQTQQGQALQNPEPTQPNQTAAPQMQPAPEA